MTYEPTFYMWCFSPQTAAVTFAHALEDHPLDNPTLESLANESGDPNAMTGFAAKIKRGWRVTDVKGKPLTDPFVKRQVVQALGPGHPNEEYDNSPQFDWDRYQYGRPMAPIQTDGA